MTKTKLSDLIPEQLEQCIGMWVETAGSLFIVQSIEQREAALISPTGIHPMYEALGQITPRFDLPRAWTPQGEPPTGEWETAEYVSEYQEMSNVYYFDGEPTHKRFVTEWEKLHLPAI